VRNLTLIKLIDRLDGLPSPKGAGMGTISFLFDGIVDFPTQRLFSGSYWLLP